MKCNLCGRQYIALGVHLRHKHAVDPDDYREEFGMLRATPLVDVELSEHLSAAANRRLLDVEYKEEVQARCVENGRNRSGKPGPGMTKPGKAALANRNKEANVKYLLEQAPKVAEILRNKKTILDVYRDIGMGSNAVRSIIAMGEAPYSKQVSNVVATQRRIESRMRNKCKAT